MIQDPALLTHLHFPVARLRCQEVLLKILAHAHQPVQAEQLWMDMPSTDRCTDGSQVKRIAFVRQVLGRV